MLVLLGLCLLLIMLSCSFVSTTQAPLAEEPIGRDGPLPAHFLLPIGKLVLPLFAPTKSLF